jgi:hypothetical protein
MVSPFSELKGVRKWTFTRTHAKTLRSLSVGTVILLMWIGRTAVNVCVVWGQFGLEHESWHRPRLYPSAEPFRFTERLHGSHESELRAPEEGSLGNAMWSLFDCLIVRPYGAELWKVCCIARIAPSCMLNVRLTPFCRDSIGTVSTSLKYMDDVTLHAWDAVRICRGPQAPAKKVIEI